MDRPPAALQLAGRALGSPPQGRTGAPSSFDPSATDHAIAAATAAKSPHAKEYGSAFAEGFSRFLRTGDLADVTVEVVTDVDAQGTAPPSLPPPSLSISPQPRAEPAAGISPASASHSPSAAGAAAALVAAAPPACSSLGEYRLHGLLLARHSAFFAAALGQVHFADSAARRIRLTLDSAAAPAWPALVDYFYSDRVRLDDSNALPLLALARQLLVPELDAYCMDYVCGRLCAANCLDHMRAAVRFSLHDLHGECVELAAQGFPLLYCGDLGGLPPASLLEILTHPLLQVHCELQVVEAVTGYLGSTAVDPGAQRALCAQIRFPYLDNATITRLAVQPTAVLAAAVIGGRPAAAAADPVATAAATEPADGGAAIAFKVPDAPPAALEGAPDAAAAAPPPAGSSVTVTHGSAAAEAAGQPATGGPGSGEGAVAGSSTTAINALGQQPEEAAAAGGGSSSGQAAPAGAVPGDGAAAITAAAAGGGANGDAAATTAAAAAVAAAANDGEGGTDSGLLSPNSSACSSPRSSAGGGFSAAAAPSLVKPHSQPHARPHRRRSKSGQTDGGDGGASGVPPPAPNPHPPHHPHAPPLLPRDLVLEGALARLAAMEFHNSLPPPSQHTSAGGTCSAAGGSGTSPPGHQALHPYLHPYQPYQFQYQYGAGAANGGGDAAAAANGGRRPLAVFRVQGAPPPQPPPPPPPLAPALVAHQQQLAAVAAALPPGGGNGGPHAHAMEHGLHYNHPAAAAGGPPRPHHRPQHHQQYHLIHPAARGFMYGSGAGGGGGGGGSLADGEAGQQQLGATWGGGGGVVTASAAAAGAATMDMAAAFAAFCLPPPRLSYCCNLVHGLPGGCAWVDVALEVLWEHLVPYITVQVSGCSEGSPRHVLSSDPDCFFETNDSADPLPWLEVQLPHNVHVLQMHRYTFLHGHRRAGYYRARNFKTQIAVRPAGEVHGPAAAAPGSPPSGGAAAGAGLAAATAAAAGQLPRGQQGHQGGTVGAMTSPAYCRYVDLTTRMAEQFDVGVLAGTTGLGPWRVLRLQATGAQEDGVHRLCVRGLRMYGIARVDLMQQAHGGFVVQPQWVLNARLDQGGSSGGAPGGGGAGGAAATGGMGFSFGGGGGAAMGAGAGGGGFGAGVLHQWIGGHQGA